MQTFALLSIQQLFHCDKFRILVMAMAGLGLAYSAFAADFKNESICKDLAGARCDGRAIAVLKHRKNYATGPY